MRRLLNRFLYFCLVTMLLTSLWACWYVSNHGFGKKWRKKVAEEFAKRGVYLTARKITLDPLRGLVAQDVKVYQDDNLERLAARINQLNLDISYTRLLQNTSFLNALELHDASVRLPIDPERPHGQALLIENLQARLYFPPERVEVRRLAGDLAGVHFSLSGTLLHPDQYRSSKKSADSPRAAGNPLARLYEELAEVRIAGRAPQLRLRFSGDLARPETLQVDEARFEAGEIRWREIMARQIQLEAVHAGGRTTLRRLSWEDAGGKLLLSGWQDWNGDFSLALHSTIAWQPAFHSVLPEMKSKLPITTGPVTLQTEASYSQSRQPALQILGQVQTGNLEYLGVPFDSVRTGFSHDGRRWMLRDLEARQNNGSLKADILGQPGGFQARLVGNIDPLQMIRAIAGQEPSVMQELSFRAPPYAELQISGSGFDPLAWKTTGSLYLGDTTFRGIPLNSARSDLEIQGRSAIFKNLQIVRDEGVGTGGFSWDQDKQEVRLTHLHSTLDPVAVCTWIWPKLGKIVSPYRFRKSPEVWGGGVIRPKSTSGTAFALQIHAPEGMDYTFLSRDLPFDQIDGQLWFRDRRLLIHDLHGTLFGGQLFGGADISLSPESRDYTAWLGLRDADFTKLTGRYFDYTGSSGELDGGAEFSGLGRDARALTGKIKTTVKNGQVFTIPVFGPLSKTLDQFLPGLGYNEAHRASATFLLGKGTLETENLEIAGKGVSMFGQGTIDFLDDEMDFNMRVNATGIPGAVLDPVSKFFEFHTNGPLKKPVWKPKNFPAGQPSPTPSR